MALLGVYDVQARLGLSNQSPVHPSCWSALSCDDILKLCSIELAASPAVALALASIMQANEIDGEVFSTFCSLQELCEHTGLPLIHDLGSVATNCKPEHGEEKHVGFARWGQVIADALLPRRLFMRTRAEAQCSASSGNVCPSEFVRALLQRMVSVQFEKEMESDQDLTVAKAEQIEALVAATHVVAHARLSGDDFWTLGPTEAVCLLPPWLRHPSHNTTQLLVSLLLQVRHISRACVRWHSMGQPQWQAQWQVPAPTMLLPLPPLPPSTIVVLGNTGAGKSTLLNAFLGETQLLPTNAMRACTASIIELEFNLHVKPGAEYSAEIVYLSVAEWEQEVRDAFRLVHAASTSSNAQERAGSQSLIGGSSEGEAGIIKAPEEDTSAKEAWDKMRAAYGSSLRWTSAEELLGRNATAEGGVGNDSVGLGGLHEASAGARAKRRIQEKLGTTSQVRASSGAALCALYSKCVDSVNDGSEGSLWPIVKRVVLRGPWPVLAHGVRLVDAPGLADDNSARDAMVKKVLEHAHAIWLVSNVRRAVNDKTTKDMMPPAFKQALMEKGVLGSLVFVATHSDVIIRSEVIENLNLPPDSSLLACTQARNDFFRQKLASDFKRGLLVDHDGGEGAESKSSPLSRACERLRWRALMPPEALRHIRGSFVLEEAALSNKLQASTQMTAAQRDGLRALISHERSVHLGFSQKLAATGRPAGAAFELATFSVSAVDYQKLAGLRVDDGPPSVFERVEDTQVPALRAFVVATAGLQRLSLFKAGAELVRCLQEAKEAATREEEEMMRKEAAPGSKVKAAPGSKVGAPASNVNHVTGGTAQAGFTKCRYCYNRFKKATVSPKGACVYAGLGGHENMCRFCKGGVLVDLDPAGSSAVACGDGTFVHCACLQRAKLQLKAGSRARVDNPFAHLHGQIVTIFSSPSADNHVKVDTRFAPRDVRAWFLVPDAPALAASPLSANAPAVASPKQWPDTLLKARVEKARTANGNAANLLEKEALLEKAVVRAGAVDDAGSGSKRKPDASAAGSLTKTCTPLLQQNRAVTQERRKRRGHTGLNTAVAQSAEGAMVIDLTDSPPLSPRIGGMGVAARPGAAVGAVISLCSSDEES